MSLALTGDTIAYMMGLGLSADQMKGLVDRLQRDALAMTPPTATNGVNEERERLRNESTYAERKRAKDRERQRRVREERRNPIFARDGYKCVYCGSQDNLQIDHAIPFARGGTEDPSNLVTACFACNNDKGGLTADEWHAATSQRHRATSRDIAATEGDATATTGDPAPHVCAQVVIPSLPHLRSEEVGVGGVGAHEPVPQTDDWPAGKAPHLAKLLVEATESPWLDLHKSLDLNTTTGRLVAWKRDGASWEHDVVPVVKALCANRRSRIASWKFFDAAIARSIADNRAALEIPAAGSVRATGPPRSFTEQIAAEHAEARRRVLES